MKTFSQFLLEKDETRVPQKPGESMEDYAKRVVAAREARRAKFNQDAAARSREGQGFRDAYNRATGRSSGGGRQTPPRSQQPAGGRQTPPTSTTSLSTRPKFRIPRPTAGQAAVGALNVGMGALDYKARRDAGQTRKQAGAGAVSSTVGGQAGWMAGAKLGAALPIPHPVAKGAAVLGLGLVGGALGAEGAAKLSDKLTGVTKSSERETLARQATAKGQGFTGLNKARQTADIRDTRKASTAYGTKQGSALTGLGGPAKVDQKAGTLTTKGKTVKLASTQLVKDPKTGKQVVGDLAYKGGKAVYLARPSVASRDTSLAANIGRALNIGKYSKAAEQQAAKQEYRTALKNTQAYTKGLGISTQSATKQGLPGYGGAKPAPKPAAKPTPAATPQQQATAQNIKSRMNAKRGGTRK
ncbi:hypothetical protein [Synechococcus phage DSL-LC03]|nr:hypothetical protein [Synechococcus phage DSL-LC03]